MKTHLGLVEYFESYLQKKGKQKATVLSYTTDVKLFANFLEASEQELLKTEPFHLKEYQSFLMDEKKEQPNSIRRKTISIRQFFRALAQENFILTTPLDDFPIPERQETDQNLLEENDIDLLLEIAKTDPNLLKSYRDGAIIAALAFEGLKVSELTHLTWQDLIIHNNLASLRINGPRARIINLSKETQQVLNGYKSHISQVDPTSTVEPKRAMFIAFKGRDSLNFSNKISRHGLKFLLYEIAEKSGIKKIHTEMLRHHSVQFLLGLGKSTKEIMEHLGLRQPGIITKHYPKPRG